jgi:glutamate racemase
MESSVGRLASALGGFIIGAHMSITASPGKASLVEVAVPKDSAPARAGSPSAASPIVVLDSGLGGLTVVRALRRLLPFEDLVYFGDTARVPYGAKSGGTVTAFVRQIIAYLRPLEPKHVVIACNTATALALPAVRAEFPGLSISGVIDPGARAAVEAAGQKPRPVFGVIATEATIRSKAYERALCRRRQQAMLMTRATPLIVPLVEEGRRDDDPVVRVALMQYLQPMLEQKMDVLLLGCTHYPVYKDLIARLAGPKVAVIDSADKCAEDVRRRLRLAGLERGPRATMGGLRGFVTDDPQRFDVLARRLVGVRLDSIRSVSPEDLVAGEAQVRLIQLRA